MQKQIVETMNAPRPVGPYSQAVMVGQFLFCSGQIAINPETNEVLQADVQTQARRVMDNLKAVVEASGLTLENVVKTTIFLTDMGDFAAVNDVYQNYFVRKFPARSTIQVSGLPKGVKVEIEAVAVRHS
ncbi:MAG TPA: RidA family protein [Bdellovibrionales bacterium]|nr:RidA family protein [Bdellovibrionales bacterium]